MIKIDNAYIDDVIEILNDKFRDKFIMGFEEEFITVSCRTEDIENYVEGILESNFTRKIFYAV